MDGGASGYAEKTTPIRTEEQYIYDYKTEHDWIDGICMTCGIKCNHYFTADNAKDGHHYCIYDCGYYDVHTRGSDGRCETCGKNLGYVADSECQSGHKYESAGSKGHACSICGTVEAHKNTLYGSWISERCGHKCTICGYIDDMSAMDHQKLLADEGAIRKYCTECDYSHEHELECDVKNNVMRCKSCGKEFAPCGPGTSWNIKYCSTTLIDVEGEDKTHRMCKKCGHRYTLRIQQ